MNFLSGVPFLVLGTRGALQAAINSGGRWWLCSKTKVQGQLAIAFLQVNPYNYTAKLVGADVFFFFLTSFTVEEMIQKRAPK